MMAVGLSQAGCLAGLSALEKLSKIDRTMKQIDLGVKTFQLVDKLASSHEKPQQPQQQQQAMAPVHQPGAWKNPDEQKRQLLEPTPLQEVISHYADHSDRKKMDDALRLGDPGKEKKWTHNISKAQFVFTPGKIVDTHYAPMASLGGDVQCRIATVEVTRGTEYDRAEGTMCQKNDNFWEPAGESAYWKQQTDLKKSAAAQHYADFVAAIEGMSVTDRFRINRMLHENAPGKEEWWQDRAAKTDCALTEYACFQ